MYLHYRVWDLYTMLVSETPDIITCHNKRYLQKNHATSSKIEAMNYRVQVTTNSDYFTIQHLPINFYNRDVVCLLRGTD